MAQTTVYTCDICKQSKSNKDLAKISIKTERFRVKDGYYGFEIDICRDCLKKKGFTIDEKDGDGEQAAIQNRATLEEKICDILMDLGVVFEE